MKLFGTDGIRGQYGVFPLDDSTIKKIGFVLSQIYSKYINKIFIAHDGRSSHAAICKELLKGIGSFENIEIIYLDLLPTPSIPYILSEMTKKDAIGIQITASHNPYTDNGLKIFNSDGFKIPKCDENRIKKLLESTHDIDKGFDLPIIKNQTYVDSYLNHIKYFLYKNLIDTKKLNIAIDCANGALSSVVNSINLPKNILFTIFNNTPNGKNINHDCGAVYPEHLSEIIIQRNSNLEPSDKKWIDFGMTFDGDGDRAILISETGRIIDGDEILFILASEGIKKSLVGTVMTNFGIRASLEEVGHKFIESEVGDKCVLDAILNNDAFMGSESSGHVIHTDVCKIPLGDAMITLIKIIQKLQHSNRSIDEIYPISLKIPSKLINIQTTNSKKFIENNHSKFKKIEELLSEDGRIFVRESGTQPMVRVLIEHKSSDILNSAEKLVMSIL